MSRAAVPQGIKPARLPHPFATRAELRPTHSDWRFISSKISTNAVQPPREHSPEQGGHGATGSVRPTFH